VRHRGVQAVMLASLHRIHPDNGDESAPDSTTGELRLQAA